MNQYQIKLPVGATTVVVEEISTLIAAARHPFADGDANDIVPSRQELDNCHNRYATTKEHLRLVLEAIENDSLPVENFMTGAPGNRNSLVLKNLVTVENLSRYVGQFRIEVVIVESINSASLPVSTPQAAPAGEPVMLSASMPKQTDDAGLSKRERQIRVIESAISTLCLSCMKIPTGEKNNVLAECKRTSDLFGGGIDPFKEAWQEAVNQKRVRMVRHNDYARK